jgi:hypothetical protein
MADQDDDIDIQDEQDGNGLHERLMDILLTEIERERYPSSNLLDLLESHMTDEDRVRIANALMDNLAADRYPSLAMVSRIARLVG